MLNGTPADLVWQRHRTDVLLKAVAVVIRAISFQLLRIECGADALDCRDCPYVSVGLVSNILRVKEKPL